MVGISLNEGNLVDLWEPNMTDVTGKSIGRYHIIDKLGEGRMAVVYKAYDTHLESEVAIKFIRVERPAPDLVERTSKRLECEAKASQNFHIQILSK